MKHNFSGSEARQNQPINRFSHHPLSIGFCLVDEPSNPDENIRNTHAQTDHVVKDCGLAGVKTNIQS